MTNDNHNHTFPPEVLRDLQDLPTIGAANAAKLAAHGITSRRQIAEGDPHELAARLLNDPEAADIGNRIDLIQGYAKAQVTGNPIVLGIDDLFLDPPRPLWFFDLEFDSEHGEVFLAGWKPWQGKVEQRMAGDKDGRRRVLLDFIEACEQENPLLVTYGSRHADEVMMRRAADAFDIPRKRVDALRYLDIQDRVVFTGSAESQLVYLPVRSFKLEEVARALGRASKGAGNIQSGYHIVQLYRNYKRDGNQRIRDRLLLYNAEDLLLLQAVFEGLRAIFKAHE